MNVAEWSSREAWPEPRPRVATWDPFVDELGDKAVALCDLAGLELDEWQEIALRLSLGKRPDNPDLWAHRLFGAEIPRQDGKGVILEGRQLVGLYLVPTELLIIHTAHEFKTATESFTRLATLVEDTPKLSREVETIYTANGKEAIILKPTDSRPRKRVKFLARSKKSGRGFTSDLLIFDEAQELSPEMVGAAGPTQSARPNPQTIYTGTAGDQDAHVWAKIRDEGIQDSPRLAWVEYSAGEPDDHVGDDIDLDDMREAYRANPAMHGPNPRMTEDAVRNDRAMMDDENFARERLCLWWVEKRVSVIAADKWDAIVKPGRKPGDRICFAVDVPPERDSASIAVASQLEDGRRHAELVEHRPGTGWVVDRLVELDREWTPGHIAIQPTSPAGALIGEIAEALKAERVPVLPISGVDLTAACGLFLDLIDNDRLEVQKNHSAPLAAAVDAVRKRELMDGGFVWNRRDATSNIAPLMALTLAVYAVGQEPKKRRKKRTSNPF